MTTPSLAQASIPELNLIPSIAPNKKDPPNHPIYDWRNIFAIIPIYKLTESQMRKTPARQEHVVDYSPKYSSAKTKKGKYLSAKTYGVKEKTLE